MELKDEIEQVIMNLVMAAQTSSINDKNNYITECVNDLRRIKKKIPD